MLNILRLLPRLLEILNKTSMQRLLIYVFVILQLTIVLTYKNEISLILMSNSEHKVEITNIPEAQERCFKLRQKHNAEAVIVYVYQPSGKNKSYKERVVFSTGDYYKPLSSMKNVNLFSRADVISTLNKKEYCVITSSSGHVDSSIISSYELDSAIITSIRSKDSNEIVGEVIWIFQQPYTGTFETLIVESQIFSHLLTI